YTCGRVILKRSHTIAVITKYATAFCVAYFIVNCKPLGNQPPRFCIWLVACKLAIIFGLSTSQIF
ncbi:hypothetical protein ACFO5T_10840, partial [Dokdonia genika]